MASHYCDIHARIPEHEKRAFCESAKSLSTSPSKLLRALCRTDISYKQGAYADYCNGETPVLILVDDTDFKKLTHQIRRFGQQYNQAVHAMNALALKNGWSYNAQRESLAPTIAILEDIQSHMDLIATQVNVIRNHYDKCDYFLLEGGGR